jgi:hypothetical protein
VSPEEKVRAELSAWGRLDVDKIVTFRASCKRRTGTSGAGGQMPPAPFVSHLPGRLRRGDPNRSQTRRHRCQRGAVDAVRCERLWVAADLPELLSANAPQRG